MLFAYHTAIIANVMNTKKTKDKLSKGDGELESLQQQLIRLQADFDNYQKRAEMQKFELIKYANAELINQILPVLDNFKRATSQAPKVEDLGAINWITGIQAIEKQIEKILSENGLLEIQIEKGQHFDPNIHEAISHEPNDLPVDTIIETVETGYKLNDKVLRPAKVRVSSGKEKTARNER